MPKSLNYRKRLEIIFLHVNPEGPKLSISKTAKRLNTTSRTVARWVERFRKTGDVLDQNRPGRGRKTSHSEDKIIEKLFLDNLQITPNEVASKMNNIGVSISPEIVKNRLREKGFTYTKPTTKPSLSKKQKKERLQFARRNKNRNWKKVIYTDETTIRLASPIQKIWRKRRGKLFLRRFKKYEKINIWGCFTINGFGKIILFKKNLNAKLLLEIYKKGLLQSYPDIPNNNMILLEDNDPKHTSKIAKMYRKKHQIQRLDWPANSPDLNPIENVWNMLKKRVAKYHSHNLNQLRTAIKKVWYSLSPTIARNLVLSMPIRMQAVIDAKGDSIEY